MGFFGCSREGRSCRGEYPSKRLLLPDERRTMRDEAGLAVWVFVGLSYEYDRCTSLRQNQQNTEKRTQWRHVPGCNALAHPQAQMQRWMIITTKSTKSTACGSTAADQRFHHLAATGYPSAAPSPRSASPCQHTNTHSTTQHEGCIAWCIIKNACTVRINLPRRHTTACSLLCPTAPPYTAHSAPPTSCMLKLCTPTHKLH